MLKTSNEWDQKWENIFFNYQKDKRNAYYINAIRLRSERKILEIAAGSFRDVAALNEWGVDCYGMDYSEVSVVKAKSYFPLIEHKLTKMDAFSLQYPDKHFDLSYHNGFWVLFDDNQIDLLMEEQVRVTKNRIVVTVHNAHNQQFVDYFRNKLQKDSLFDIRFFSLDEIKSLVEKKCKNVQVIPVGKAYKKHEDLLIRFGWGFSFFLRAYFSVSGHSLLQSSERLMCIGEIK